jgi:putative membrane protein
MDPGMARAGSWTWGKGGGYLGVPFQNFVGWVATTLTIYVLVAVAFRLVPRRQVHSAARFYIGVPALAYALVALDQLLVVAIPELHIVAAFGMLAILRSTLVRGPIALPG